MAADSPPGIQPTRGEREPAPWLHAARPRPQGRLGLRIDVNVDGDEVAASLEDAYRLVAPIPLVTRLDER